MQISGFKRILYCLSDIEIFLAKKSRGARVFWLSKAYTGELPIPARALEDRVGAAETSDD